MPAGCVCITAASAVLTHHIWTAAKAAASTTAQTLDADVLTLHARVQVLEGEKGVKCYGLAKTMSDNFKYVGYEGEPHNVS